MIGAIIGDIAGSIYEFDNIKTKEFPFFSERGKATDDSIMSLAVAGALLAGTEDAQTLQENTVRLMQEVGRNYPDCGYGNRFIHWIFSEDPKPYNSYGNGSAMRVSACAWAGESLEDALRLARLVTAVSHDHPEGMKGAEAVTEAVWMALHGAGKEEIRAAIDRKYYPMNFTLEQIRPEYTFDVTCQGSVPQALMAFFESEDFEDAIRNAISIGGDSDTLAAMTGAVAEAFYGVPEELRRRAEGYLDERLLGLLRDFEEIYPGKHA